MCPFSLETIDQININGLNRVKSTKSQTLNNRLVQLFILDHESLLIVLQEVKTVKKMSLKWLNVLNLTSSHHADEHVNVAQLVHPPHEAKLQPQQLRSSNDCLCNASCGFEKTGCFRNRSLWHFTSAVTAFSRKAAHVPEHFHFSPKTPRFFSHFLIWTYHKTILYLPLQDELNSI